MFRFLPYERYMMPGHFGPLYQDENSSGWYRDVTMMIVPYVTDREKLAAFLPEPFSVGEFPVVTVAYACSKDVDWLAGRGYNLVAVTASAVFNGKNEQLVGQFSLVWWENLADAILSGRELTGIPKIYGEITDHAIEDGRWHSRVSHFEHRILDLSVSNLRPATPAEIETSRKAMEGRDHPMAWRFLPGVGGFGATVSEPTTFPSESAYTEVSVGEGTVDWNRLTWKQNPTQFHIVNALADLPVLAYLPAMVTRGSTNLFVPDRPPRVLDKPETLPEANGANAAERTIEEIDTVCFIGAGTMGCVNALVAAISGYNVELYDVSGETLKRVPQRFKEFSVFLVGAGYCTPAAVGAAFGRISVGSDLAKATASADLVSESVFEDLDLKREIHGKLDEICPEGAILTTNTSGFVVSEIEDVVARGDRFAAMHSYLASRLVDVVPGPRTSEETVDILCRYVESLGLVPMVLRKEHPGYVMNALLASVFMTANALVAGGLASREDVDRAYMVHLEAPMGPFGIMDMIGLDMFYSQLAEGGGNEYLESLKARTAAFFEPFVTQGKLGIKTGEGFYAYPDPAFQQAEFLQVSGNEAEIFQALATALIRGAVTIVLKDVAGHEDIDRTWCIGTGLGIGPFGLLEKIGTDGFMEISGKAPECLRLLSDRELEQVEAYIASF
jgi:3-hydroxybutyryl-CoA dehydrogenase